MIFKKKQYLFVLGEPGFGKSRLLKELLLKQEKENKLCAFIDLKNIYGNLVEYIQTSIGTNQQTDAVFNMKRKIIHLQNINI